MTVHPEPCPYRGADRRTASERARPDYRGPNRRTPSSISRRQPGWRAAILGFAVVLVVGLVIRALIMGGSGLVVTYAAVRDSGAGLLVLAGSLLVVLWGLSGRAGRAFDGSALLLMGGGLLMLAGPWDAWLHSEEFTELLSPGARLALGLPVLLLLGRSARLLPVDSSVRAMRSLTNATALTLGLLGLEALLRIAGPVDSTVGWRLGLLILAAGWTAVGLQRVLRPDPRGTRRCERMIGLALVAWGLGDVPLAIAMSGSLRWGTAGAAAQLAGSALAAWAAVSLLLEELSHDGTRRLRLMGELADVSTVLEDEQTVRRLLVHDARNVVAAIHAATITLERHGERLEPAVQAQLREAVGSEFSKLQSLLDPTEPASSRMKS